MFIQDDVQLEDITDDFSSNDDFFPYHLPVIPSAFVSNERKLLRKLSVKELKIQRSELGATCRKVSSRARIIELWRMAYALVRKCHDPWSKFNMEMLPVQRAKRFRYNAVKAKWMEDIVQIRMETKPFGNGAMRECFRAKKLSNFSHSDDWNHACNFVAKRYIETVSNEVYFDDVRLQMDAKLWGEAYNRNPAVSKKVDVALMCVIQLIEQPDEPLFHLEHFIEGTYRKYNSNSGFVDDMARNTPQAFSHFTFERSAHRLIVVDIQGVGDLWTDPQIHTFDGKAYGDGNLGLRGMALFFHTHHCNPLCTALELDQFDLCPGEQEKSTFLQPPERTSTGGEVHVKNGVEWSPQFGETVAVSRSRRAVARRPISETNEDDQVFVDPADFESHSLPAERHMLTSDLAGLTIDPDLVRRHQRFFHPPSVSDQEDQMQPHSMSPLTNLQASLDSGVFLGQSTPAVTFREQRRRNLTGESRPGPLGSNELASWGASQTHLDTNRGLNGRISSGSSVMSRYDAEKSAFFERNNAFHRSSSIAGIIGSNASILGLIHHELARLHSMGRFARGQGNVNPNHMENSHQAYLPSLEQGLDALAALHLPTDVNWDAVIFHEEQAAYLNCPAAVECLAQYYLGLPIDGPLSDCPIAPDPLDAPLHGFTLMTTAAASGDRSAMLYIANANYTGTGNNPSICIESSDPDWEAAVHWYEKAAKALDDSALDSNDGQNANNTKQSFDSFNFGSATDWPVYRLHGRMAEMYHKGGYGLKRDPNKAYELYESAADGASEAHQGRLAMQYYEQAALLEEECGDMETF